jgi:hypothetical protein
LCAGHTGPAACHPPGTRSNNRTADVDESLPSPDASTTWSAEAGTAAAVDGPRPGSPARTGYIGTGISSSPGNDGDGDAAEVGRPAVAAASPGAALARWDRTQAADTATTATVAAVRAGRLGWRLGTGGLLLDTEQDRPVPVAQPR